MKLFLIATLSLAACDLSDQRATERPETLAYITEAILAPSCGTSQCHSAMVAQATDVFDSVQGAQDSITTWSLIAKCPSPPCDDAPASSYLYRILSTGVENTKGFGDRMPLDEALSNSDIELIHNWIRDGAHGVELN